MHKAFYASGFLYHLPSQQILLQQLVQEMPNASFVWSMFGGVNNKGEQAEIVFQRIIRQFLKIKISTDSIYPIYDYFHSEYKKFHYVFYAEVTTMRNIHVSKENNFSWFTFKQTSKLPFTKQTKQDIIVAERVIRANARDNEVKMASLPNPFP